MFNTWEYLTSLFIVESPADELQGDGRSCILFWIICRKSVTAQGLYHCRLHKL